ncbi:MAG: hypothetical protein WCY19_02745 [Candidatus Gastranaerophilaceae bacterium]
MSDLCKDFEKRFTNAWFSADWVEVEVKPQVTQVSHKDLATLQAELDEIRVNMENVVQKQLRLANLAKLYN